VSAAGAENPASTANVAAPGRSGVSWVSGAARRFARPDIA